MAAPLDHISAGRLELGLGAGWYEHECDAYGIELGSLAERFDRFDEACEIIVSLLTRETTTFTGAHYQLTDARCQPAPLQTPHPPICIGGKGERRTLRAVARWAQHWNLPSGPVEEFRHKWSVIESHCETIGRDPGEIITSTHLRLGQGGEVGPLIEQAAEFNEAGLDLGIVRLDPPYSPATLEAIASALADAKGLLQREPRGQHRTKEHE
jgi:alkanesulfonate monooxygenase SsuD/methylene tetrahydromethanopterin reductase-like flavin-dependent oxidoreductase (luciferase family)